jgi:putative ABC transport system permease protein
MILFLTTTPSYLTISNLQLVGAALLMLINGALSLLLRLGIEQQLLVGSLRMVVQLLLIGYVLEWIFTLENPIAVLSIALVMTAIAGVSAVDRTGKRFVGIYWNSFVSVLAAAFLVTGLAVGGILQVKPWYNPQYVIPLLGMVLGNTLNGISLALDRFLESLNSRQAQIEALLALGATRWEASHGVIREAMRTGMIPTINSMMVMGLVSLPGMMTGQILAGASPADAVRYQIVIMFLIASGTALGAFGIVMFAFFALLNAQHQLCLSRLK